MPAGIVRYIPSQGGGTPADTTPPSRSNGSPNGVLAFGTSATTLSLTTDEAATCRYSTTASTPYASGTAFSTTGSTSHSTTVTGLTNGTAYTYYVRCIDTSGNANTTDFAISFSIAADTTAPTVSLTAPLTGNTVTGHAVTLSATASDDVALANVQFKVDGANIGAAISSAPYSTTWDSGGVGDGNHTLYAVAKDTSGNYATSSVSVTIDNTAPVISSISSGTPGTISATITWGTNEAASSTVNYGLTNSYGTASTSGSMITSHSVTLTGLSASTSYHYKVLSADAAGNVASSTDQTFTTASLPMVSGAIRARVNDGAGAIGGTNIALTWRTREKTSVALSSPKIEFWNGYVNAALSTSAQEVGVGNVAVVRAALVTNISGAGLNQSGATLTQLTWTKAAAGSAGYLYKLNGVSASASDFTSNGGTISGDGLQITIPDGYVAISDEATSLSISAGSSYFVQIENAAGNAKNVPLNTAGVTALGDARALTTSGTGTKVFATDWSSGASLFAATGEEPQAIWGSGPAGTKVACTAGDSIIYGNQDSISGSTAIVGDADGAIGFANRAFNSMGYSSVRTAISSTRASQIYTYGGQAIRLFDLRYCSATLTDMGHNDRTMPWSGAAGTGYLATYRWYWNTLRGAMLGGTGRVVSTDLLPSSASTDNWATTVNQTSTTGTTSVQYASINPFFAAGSFNTSLGDPDAAYSINGVLYAGAAANGFTDIDSLHISWPANGNPNPSAATFDGTHPKGAVHAYIASDLATHLASLLGF